MTKRSLILALVLLLSACWTTRVDHSLNEIQDRGVLRVGTDPSWPPFEWVDEATGELRGFDIDLARELGRHLGVEVEFVLTGWDGLYDALLAGRFDAIISALPYDPLRTEEVAYTTSYFDAGPVLLVPAQSPLETLDDLNAHRVAVVMGSEGDVQMRKLQQRRPALTVVPLLESDDVLTALEAGKVDAAVVDHLTALIYQSQHPDTRIIGPPMSEERFVIAVRKKDAALRNALDTALITLQEDGTLQQLRSRWFTSATTP